MLFVLDVLFARANKVVAPVIFGGLNHDEVKNSGWGIRGIYALQMLTQKEDTIERTFGGVGGMNIGSHDSAGSPCAASGQSSQELAATFAVFHPSKMTK